MSLRKQYFYEGAALHGLVRTGLLDKVRYTPPFLSFNESISVLLKYCTRGRSPWGFTFAPEEQQALARKAAEIKTYVGLICGSDGVTAIEFEAYALIAKVKSTPIRLSCFRDYGEHYEVRGPDGVLPYKVPPSAWQKILGDIDNEAYRSGARATAHAN
jgi:hypothetical protein